MRSLLCRLRGHRWNSDTDTRRSCARCRAHERKFDYTDRVGQHRRSAWTAVLKAATPEEAQ